LRANEKELSVIGFLARPFMKIRAFVLTLVCAVVGPAVDAQTFEDDLDFNPEISGGNRRIAYTFDDHEPVPYQMSGVSAAAQQADGKIIIAGVFTTVGGKARRNIARLNEDGSLDPSFDAGLGPDATAYLVTVTPEVHTITFQRDGKILIGGDFETVNGLPYRGIARLNENGGLDTSFNPG